MKRLLFLALPLALLAAAAWVLATESGLQFAVHAAQSLTEGRLRMTGASGRLVAVAGFDEVVYEHPASTVQLRDVRLELRLTRLLIGRVQAKSLGASSLTVTTHDRGVPTNDEPLTVRLPLRIAVEDGRIGRFQLRLRDGAQRWEASEVRFAARWRDEWIVVGGLSAVTREAGPVALSGRLAFVDSRMLLEEIQVDGPGSLAADGALALSGARSNNVSLEWKRLRWPEGLDSATGRAHFEGPWAAYGWSVDARIKAVDLDGELEARGRGSLEHLDVQRLRLGTLGGEVRGSGRVGWSKGLRTSATLALDRIDPGVRFPGWKGTVNGTASFAGTWAGPVPNLEFDAQLKDSMLRGYPLTLAVRGTTENRRVILDELVLGSGPSTLRARGRLLPDFDLAADLKSPDLHSLWAGLSGSAALQFSLKGAPATPRLRVSGGGADLAYKAPDGPLLRAARAQVSANLSETGPSEFKIDLEEADLGASLRRARFGGDGTLARHRLRLAVEADTGDLSLQLDGGYRRSTWRGQVHDAQLAPHGEAPWVQEARAAVELAPPRWALERVCLARKGGRICAEARAEASGGRAAAELDGFEFSNLRQWLPADWTIQGSLTGTASARWRTSGLDDIRIDLESTAGHLEGAGVRLEFGPGLMQIEPQDERLRARLRLRPAGGELEGDVWLESGGLLMDRPVTGELRARLPDLTWLPVLSTEVASASGALDSRLTLTGTLRSPSLQGRVLVQDGRVQLATPGIELTDIAASFESGQAMPLAISVSAHSGGGTLELDGGIERLRPQIKGRFKLTGEGAQWINTPEIRAWVTPRLDLTLSGPDSRLEGEILVPRAAITPRGLSSGGVAPSGDQVLIESDAAPNGRALRFDGLGLKTRLEGAITASDQPGRPTRGLGELRLVGGRYKAYGQDLTIETGRLLFNGGPVTEPGIELSAYRRPIENVLVGLRARGPLAAPSFSLYSDPEMSQEEQLSWLVLGRKLSETLQSGQRTELDGAAASLGFAGGEYLAQQLAPRVGLDEVTVGTRPGETGEQARFTIGKYLSPKLFVSYGFGLFQPGNFFRLQYDLGSGFKLRGESGVEQGGDLIYILER